MSKVEGRFDRGTATAKSEFVAEILGIPGQFDCVTPMQYVKSAFTSWLFPVIRFLLMCQ